MFKSFFMVTIRLYQLTLSPIIKSLGFECRYYPSCSEYSKECFKTYPTWKALIKSSKRILRCNPLFEGGIDLPT